MICEACDGCGYFDEGEDEDGVPWYEECPRCNGTGVESPEEGDE